MAKRLVSAAAAILLLFAVLYADSVLNIKIAAYAIAVLAAVALKEMYKPLGITKHKSLCVIGILTMFAVIFASEYVGIIVSISIMLFFTTAVFRHDKIKFNTICAALFATLYISFGFHYLEIMLKLKCGMGMLFFVLIAAFVTDSGAYFTGRAIGKHKLAPNLSPKKTIEGSVGGIVCSVIAIFIYKYIMQYAYAGTELNTVNIIIDVVIAAVAGEIGDLSASLVKREFKIKDYGKIMPGHGGVLDRFDSILFVAPTVYLLNGILPIIR